MANTNIREETESIAADTGRSAPASMPLRLPLPEPRFQPIVPSEQEGSSPEELDHIRDDPIPEEDARSVVGVSISRAQTRLMSPQTPAAEKAAALADIEGGRLFDGAVDEPEESQLVNGGKDPRSGTLETKFTRPSTPNEGHDVDLPSPWRATPKTFERSKTNQQSYQHSGATSMLSDLNVRRYLANFNLPSLPKTPTFTSLKDFSVPSLASILSSTRSHSPLRKGSVRPKRASTYTEPALNTSYGSVTDKPSTQDRGRGRGDLPAGERSFAAVGTQSPGYRVEARATAPGQQGHRRSISDGSLISPVSPRLRKSRSNQSLLLRRATSTTTSLGDDSRWENVQEQVNSRMKAIKDSLQDSSMKLPSMPNLSSFNLGSFRPEFIRSRAHSEVKSPSNVGNENAYHNSAIDSRNGDLAPRERQAVTDTRALQDAQKRLKPTHPYLDKALENLTGDIVIMGGYRGSILRSAKPPFRQLWVPVKVGLNIRRVNLEVGLQPEDEENMRDEIFASGMLSHIGPVDMGRRLLKRLRACKNVQEGRLRVHDYGYDWRLSPHFLSDRLIEFLKCLRSNAPDVPKDQKGATIIAHSMGGLITRHAVNRNPGLFAGVIYAGVPQHCVNILGPLRNGDEVLLSSKVLTAQVNFTLRSSYLLLPDDGKCFINRETKEEYPVNFFDVEHWKQYAWSPCIAPALPPVNLPENKTLFGSVTDMLPSMPSLPLPGRKSSVTKPKDEKSNLADAAVTASRKMNDIANPTGTHAVDPQMSTPSSVSANNGPQSTIPLPYAIAYLKRTLDATLAFKAELAPNLIYAATNAYPPLAILYANNTPTVSAARVASREAIRRADAYDDLQFGSGDGVCLARAAMLPDGFSCVKGGRVRTERGHVGLLGDLEAVGKCLLALMDGRRHGIGLGVKEKHTA